MMLFEKMNAAMRHSAEEGKKRRELDAQKNGGMRAELERPTLPEGRRIFTAGGACGRFTS